MLRSVTIVTATTTLHARFDLEKIARFVEELPDIDGTRALEIIGRFRKSQLARPFHDAAAPSARNDLNALHEPKQIESYRGVAATRGVGIINALAILSRNPRTLKKALRSCKEFWDKLPGEIDFDDLLVMSLVREGCPKAFAVISHHLDTLRRAALSQNEEKQTGKTAWLDELRALGLADLMRAAVQSAVTFVFDSHASKKPQGLAQNGHTNYWARFHSLPDLGERELDQPVLELLRSGTNEQLLDALDDEHRSEAVLDFSSTLVIDRVVALLLPVIERCSLDPDREWEPVHSQAFRTVRRIWLRRSETGDLVADVVLREVRRAFDAVVPCKLGIAPFLEEYFVLRSKNVIDLLDDKSRSEARTHLRQRLRETCSGKPGPLASGLRGAHRYTLCWLCWGLDRVGTGDYSGLPFDGWGEFADTILEATRRQPRDCLPQLAGLVTRVDRTSETGERLEFDPAVTRRLFGTTEPVLELFAAEDPGSWQHMTSVQGVIRAATAEVSGRAAKKSTEAESA